jgi:hypothetical protein
MEKIQVAHPASNPVLDSFAKQHSNRGRDDQDAIEDYSESGAKVQVLYLQIRQVVGSFRRNRIAHRDCCSVWQSPDLLWLWAPTALV